MIDIFISSASELGPERDRLEQFAKAAQYGLRQTRWGIDDFPVVSVTRWEDMTPQKTGRNTNQLFVERAKRSHVTVALLSTALKPGTKGEIEAVLRDRTVQLSIIWIRPKDETVIDSKLRAFMRAHQEHAYWTTVPNKGQELSNALISILASAIGDFIAMHLDRRGDYDEDR